MFENNLPLGEYVLRLNAYARETTLTKERQLAINSMYRWYENSAVCYVYLNDVERSPKELHQYILQNSCTGEEYLEQQIEFRQQFRQSCWFTRGWTLQELLAPNHLIFFSANWKTIGDRREFADEISRSTNIRTRYLKTYPYQRYKPLSSASVATKMSFASHRVTSREEDIAYCLLGLFDVNMPLLYGEGAIKAFQRLQIEIMRSSTDDSLFAWTLDLPAYGMLASKPSYFAHSGDVKWENDWRRGFQPPWSFSSRGLEFPIPDHLPVEGLVPIYLNCYKEYGSVICIQLRLRGKTARRTTCGIMDAAGYPQPYDSRSKYDLSREDILTRMVYIRQPSEIEIEYGSLLASIEEGRLNLTDIIRTDTHLDRPFLNIGPVSITADKSFPDPGHVWQVDEARAFQRTQGFLRAIAAKNVFLSTKSGSIIEKNEEEIQDRQDVLNRWLARARDHRADQ